MRWLILVHFIFWVALASPVNVPPQIRVEDGFSHLPIFPPALFQISENQLESVRTMQNRSIPRIAWLTGRNATELAEWEHIVVFKNLNPNWTVNIWGDDEVNHFMRTYYNNSRVLWAFENINSVYGGASKADVWRYAVLLVFGGLYVDVDSSLFTALDNVVHDDDEMYIGFERNMFEPDECYPPFVHHSRLKQQLIHNPEHNMELGERLNNVFGGHIILNWCVISAPHHQFLKNALEKVVLMMEYEYLRLPAPTVEPFYKHVLCVTGPQILTAAYRDAYATNMVGHLKKYHSLPAIDDDNKVECQDGMVCRFRLSKARDFLQDGASFKYATTNHPHHYMKAQHVTYLEYYADAAMIASILAASLSRYFDSVLVMGDASTHVYYVYNGTKHAVDSLGVLNAHNFSLNDLIFLPDDVIASMPTGAALSHSRLPEGYFPTIRRSVSGRKR